MVDVRLNNVSQLAGFAKKEDLAYFLKTICGIDYVHLPLLAPTQEMLDDFKKKGVDTIACLSVNDAFVMGAWAKDQNVFGDIVMLTDGSGEFARAIGLDADFSKFGMGPRSKRYSMIVKDGVVEKLNVEEAGQYKVSSAEDLLGQLG